MRDDHSKVQILGSPQVDTVKINHRKQEDSYTKKTPPRRGCKMKTIITVVSTVLVIIGGVWLLVLFAKAAVESYETKECKQWAEDAEKYPGYYLTQWQADQCEARGVKVNAPIGNGMLDRMYQ